MNETLTLFVTVRMPMKNQRAASQAQSRARNLQYDVYKAVADPTRRAILDYLRTGPKPVNELASAFPVSRPAVSKHLRILRQSSLVRENRDGRFRMYELNAAPLAEVEKWLGEYRQFWRGALQRLKHHVENKKVKR